MLYRAAIFERNRDLIPQRILDAETEIIRRGRELLRSHGTIEEKQEIEDALYTLRAFRKACEHLNDAA